MTNQIKKYGSLPKTFVLMGMAALYLSTALTQSFAQEAENDGPGPIVDETNLVFDEENETEDPFARQLRVEPIGAVNEGVRIEETDPYSPEGLRLGTFTFRPSLEVGIAATRELTQTLSGTPSTYTAQETFSVTNQNALGLLINSDWSRHALEVDINGNLPVGISGETRDPTFEAQGTLSLDIASSTALSLNGQYNYSTEAPQSSAYQNAISSTVTGINDPVTQLYAGEAVLNHDFGGLTAQITASIGRLEYSAARLSDGSTVSQSDLNSTDYNIALRGGYALSGVLSPFVEANYGQRITDESLDSGGFNRSSTRYGLRLGTLIDVGEKLSGEVALGYGVEKLDDALLADIAGFTVDAALNWSPQRGTEVTLRGSTEFQPSGDDDVSGSLLYATELGLTHRLNSQLTANASIGASFETFEGLSADEISINGALGMAYNINRYVALTGRLTHEQTFSSDIGARSSSTGAFLGMRFQR